MSELNPLAGVGIQPSENQPPNPTPNPAPSAPPAAGSNYDFTKSEVFDAFKKSLPEDIRGEPSFNNFKDFQSFAKSWVHSQKAIGAEKIAVPSKYATKEEIREMVFRKLGHPEKAEDYKVDLGDASEMNKEFLEQFKKTAWEANILPSQATELAKWFETHSKQVIEAQQKSESLKIQEGLQSLQEEWGKAANQKFQRASMAVKELGGEELVQFFKDNPAISTNPLVIKAFERVASELMTDKLSRDPSSGLNVLTPEQAKRQVNAILGDPKHPYNDGTHPSHADAVKDVTKLFESMFPSEQAG